jgi:hypothetical protein
MDESPNPSENEKPGVRLGRISPSGCKKGRLGAESGGRLEMLSYFYVSKKYGFKYIERYILEEHTQKSLVEKYFIF